MTLKNSNVFDKGGDLNHMTEDVEKRKKKGVLMCLNNLKSSYNMYEQKICVFLIDYRLFMKKLFISSLIKIRKKKLTLENPQIGMQKLRQNVFFLNPGFSVVGP